MFPFSNYEQIMFSEHFKGISEGKWGAEGQNIL